MKFMLSLLIFILSHVKGPSKSTAGDKAWNRKACKPVSQRKQVQIKRIFSVTELFSAQWKTVSERQVSAEAGGELTISAPALHLKDKQCFIAMISSTMQNYIWIWSISNRFYHVKNLPKCLFFWKMITSKKYFLYQSISIKTLLNSHIFLKWI